MSVPHLAPDWGAPVGGLGKGEQQLPPNSTQSDQGTTNTAAKPEEPRNAQLTDTGTAKKKRAPKFLAKQFGIITKASSAGSPRRNLKLLGKEYILAVPGTGARAETDVDPDPSTLDNRDQSAKAEPPIDFVTAPINFAAEAEQHRNAAKLEPPIQFVTAPIDYQPEQLLLHGVVKLGSEPPLDFVTERSPRILPQALPNVRLDSLSRTHSLSRRSPSGSERLAFSHGSSLRSERSVLSIPETVMSSAEHGFSRGSLKSPSRTSLSSLEWSGQEFGSLDRHGELSIAGLSLEEGRNLSGVSRRTDFTSAQSPARSDTHTLDYSPDDTDSGVEMYHETTSASPGSYSSRRSSCSVSEDWVSEFEDSDRMPHHDRRSKHRSDASCSSGSYSSHAGPREYPARTKRNKSEFSPSARLRKLEGNQLLDSPSNKMRQSGDYYHHHKRNDNSSLPKSSFSSRRHSTHKRHSSHSAVSSKVVVLLGQYGSRKGHRVGTRGLQSSGSDVEDRAIPLDSITPQEAIAVFHDEVARMMLEEGQDCGEANDVEEFLHGYMSLRSPFYLAMVDEFFRAVCVDCYKRPVELPVETTPRTFNRSGSFSVSYKSLRSSKSLSRSESQRHSSKRLG